MDPRGDVGEILLRLAIALLLGGAIGFEREWHRKPAGLRSHVMVALGATTFTLGAMAIFGESLERGGGSLAVDPLRLVQGLVGGIGFLGAGAIIHSQGKVEGLTTAGGLWLVGALGMAVGSGHYLVAVAATVMALVAVQALTWVAHRIQRRRGEAGEVDGAGDGREVPS